MLIGVFLVFVFLSYWYIILSLIVAIIIIYILHKKHLKKTVSKEKYSDEFIENYARYCNAYLEHEEEMEQYKEYFNIKDNE